jgi:putative membrane protein
MPFRDLIAPLNTSKTLNHIALLAVAMGVYATLPVAKEYSSYKEYGDSPSELHAALSLTLGWLLVFRTNAAYARWWEARTLWGCLINATRNLSMKLSTLASPTQTDARFLAMALVEFPQALKCHLRNETYDHRELITEHCPSHTPLAIANRVYAWVHRRKEEGRIDGDDLRVIDVELAKLMDVCGACERIARTPIVRSYRIFTRQCIMFFLFTLPWGIAEDFKWWTIPLTMVISYFMIGMEIVAEHVEEPFGFDEDDLDLDGMCKTIEASVKELFRPCVGGDA